MFIMTRHDIQRIAVSAAGALLVSTACIGAAVFPAKAEAIASTAAGWQAEVERQIDEAMRLPAAQSSRVVTAEVTMRFDRTGQFRSASLAHSSGIPALDREALRVANTIRYPALPTHLQGKPQQVGMQIMFGNSDTAVREATEKAHAAATALAAKADAGRAEARIAGQPAG